MEPEVKYQRMILCLLCGLLCVRAENNKQAVEKKILDWLLSADRYDPSVRPKGNMNSDIYSVLCKAMPTLDMCEPKIRPVKGTFRKWKEYNA